MDGIFAPFLDELAQFAIADDDLEAAPITNRMRVPTAPTIAMARRALPPPPSRSATPLTGRNQVLVPSQNWDWSTSATGSIPTNQFYLADNLPQSTQNGGEFASSSDSFSKNYRLFLNMIDVATFPASVGLQQAKQRITAPTSSPASGTAPPGWTKIMPAGVLRWAPNWVASQTSKSWTNEAITKPPQRPQTIRISLNTGGQPSAVARDLITNHPATQPEHLLRTFSAVSITAKNWGKITLSPGDWFESGLLQVGQSYMKNPEMFFGASGLLRGRVSAFYVGFDVSLKFSGNQNLTQSQQTSITQNRNLELLGIPLALDQTNSDLTGSMPTITYAQTQKSPEIIAVEIETYPLIGT